MRTAPRPTASPLGAYIQEKRRAAELSQGALAELVGTTQGGVSNWESGGAVPSPKFIYEIARNVPGADADEMLKLIAESEA